MPDPNPYLMDRGSPTEFADVLAEFGGHAAPNVYDDDATSDDPGGDEWPEPDEDDLDLLGLGSQGATIEYQCTREELEEAGYGGGYSEEDPAQAPDIDSEFMAPAVVTDPLDYLETRGCTVRDLLDMVERWDWTALPGFMRLASAVIDGLCVACPLDQA
jgi:hypothetical protein